jgi:nucleoside-diphosphate-sugar epimerase
MKIDLGGQRALVTGATGFIGANLLRRLLRDGAEVVGISRSTQNLWRLDEIIPQIELVQANMADPDRVAGLIRQHDPDFIVHLAVERPVQGREGAALEANVEGMRNLLQAAGSRRCVVLGSSLEYAPKNGPMVETDRIQPTTRYAESKAAATQIAQEFAKRESLPIVILRAFYVYGPWEPGHRFVPKTILAALQGGEIALTKTGYRHDFVFVDDVIDACLASLQASSADKGEIFNVGSGRQWTNEEVVAMIEQVTGETIRVRDDVYPARDYDRSNWVADIRKAKEKLSWEPANQLQKGLEKTVAWVRGNLAKYGK